MTNKVVEEGFFFPKKGLSLTFFLSDLFIIFPFLKLTDGLVVCHLPFGPTAYFTLYNVVMRHDVPDIGTMSEAFPHLIFHNFTTRLGKRVSIEQTFIHVVLLCFFIGCVYSNNSNNLVTQVSSILKYLFPVPKEDSRRVITFANQEDFISFRSQSHLEKH